MGWEGSWIVLLVFQDSGSLGPSPEDRGRDVGIYLSRWLLVNKNRGERSCFLSLNSPAAGERAVGLMAVLFFAFRAAAGNHRTRPIVMGSAAM